MQTSDPHDTERRSASPSGGEPDKSAPSSGEPHASAGLPRVESESFADGPTDPTTKEPTSDSASNSTARPATDATNDPANSAATDATSDPANDSATDATNDPANGAATDASSDPANDAATDAASGPADDAATDAASGPANDAATGAAGGEKASSPADSAGGAKIDTQELHDRIVDQMKTVYDPEIPVDIYELGMIYEIDVEDDGRTHVTMTLTSPACPVAGTLPGEVEVKLNEVDGVKDGKVELVWDPPWSPDLMSESAKLELGMM